MLFVFFYLQINVFNIYALHVKLDGRKMRKRNRWTWKMSGRDAEESYLQQQQQQSVVRRQPRRWYGMMRWACSRLNSFVKQRRRPRLQLSVLVISMSFSLIHRRRMWQVIFSKLLRNTPSPVPLWSRCQSLDSAKIEAQIKNLYRTRSTVCGGLSAG